MSANRAQEKAALFVAMLTSFMGPFIISSVNVALPSIQNEFNADAVQLSWIATSLLLATARYSAAGGQIRRHPRTQARVCLGTGPFHPGIRLCRFFIFRGHVDFFPRGAGSGLGDVHHHRHGHIDLRLSAAKKGRVIGIYVSAVYIGLSVGPFAGGMLTQHVGWRSLGFFLVSPFGVLSFFMTLKYLKGEWADAPGETLDVIGGILYAVSILALVYGASLLPDINAVYLIASGVLCLGIFVRHELRVPYPLIDVGLFSKNRLFAFSSLAALINYSATFAVSFLLSLYLQYIKGMTAQFAGTVPYCPADYDGPYFLPWPADCRIESNPGKSPPPACRSPPWHCFCFCS